MCMLTNSGAVAHYHTSLNLPASSVPSKSLTALVQLVHQSRTYSTRQASLLISGRTCLIQEQLTGTSVSRSPAPAKLASKQGVHSSFQTTSSTRNKRPQFHSPWFCSASASPATLADALRSQQKQAVHLICLASTVAALLLNPASCLASETCQVIVSLHMRSNVPLQQLSHATSYNRQYYAAACVQQQLACRPLHADPPH